MAKVQVTQAPIGASLPTVDINKSELDGVVWNKGLDVVHETALQCACKSKNTNYLSSCKNCGSTGWVFINPKKTKMVMHSMNLNTQFKEWSEERLGTASITALDTIELAFMDRITVSKGNSVFSESLFYRQADTDLFFYTVYDIKEIMYIALFDGVDNPFKRLILDMDYTFEKNVIRLDNKYYDALKTDQDLSITIRYKHSPQFHVIDIPRDIFISTIRYDNNKNVQLPIHAIGRRSHYVLTAENLSGTRLVDNSYDINSCDNKNPKQCL